MNLLRNASQAMKGRGRIMVSSRVRFGRGTRSGTGSSDEPFVELTVADNGPGLSQKVLENLFMPFFTTKEKGTGLGLAISQRIVQGAGGRIDARSYEGKGSTFSVVLPAAPDALGTPTPGPAKAAAAPAPAPRTRPERTGSSHTLRRSGALARSRSSQAFASFSCTVLARRRAFRFLKSTRSIS